MGSSESTVLKINPLATEDQFQIEVISLRLLQRADVLVAKEKAKKILRNAPLAATKSGIDTLDQALDEGAQCLLYDVIIRGSEQPRIGQSANVGHSWFGHTVKGARYGIDNPDTIYRYAVLDPTGEYRIVATPGPGEVPVQLSFLLYPNFRAGAVVPGTEPDVGEVGTGYGNDAIANGLFDRDIRRNTDGSFSVNISSEANSDAVNHIQIDEFATTLFMRQAIPRWGIQTPYYLEIERLDVNRRAVLSDAELAKEFISRIDNHIDFWVKAACHYMFQTPLNTLPEPTSRGGDWGYGTLGNFALNHDEALIVTVDPDGAAYTGFILADPWMISPQHVSQSGSLNNTQSFSNNDGTFTYVIAHRDPGIQNWLNTNGLQRGGLMIRWQAFESHPESGDGLLKSVKKISLSDLDKNIPGDTPRLTLGQRESLLKDRVSEFNRRFID